MQIATDKATDGSVGSVPVLDARFSSSQELNLAHGSRLMPTFETLEVDKLEKLTCLIRDPKVSSSHPEVSSSIVVPETGKARVLAPGPSMIESTATKRKAGAGDEQSVSMVDR